jgi:hypothetical protein
LNGQLHPKGWNDSGRPDRPSEANSAGGLHLAVAGLAGSAAHPDRPDGTEKPPCGQRGVI